MKALIFPGQGSQFIGMGYDLAQNFTAAHEVFDIVDTTLGESLSALMFSGDITELTATQNTQPAIMAVSMAVFRVLQTEMDLSDVAYVAGHSLGEYTALTATGSLDIATSAKLLRARGLAMAHAGANGGGMAAVLGLSIESALSLTTEVSTPDELCVVANDNCPGQIVISGHPSAIARAVALGPLFGAKKVIPLAVSGAFHSPLMQPAATAMATMLDQTPLLPPRWPVISNITASPETDPVHIKQLLIQQITGTVRWTESVQFMTNNGVDTFLECGPGKVLAGLIARTSPTTPTHSLNSVESIKAYLTTR